MMQELKHEHNNCQVSNYPRHFRITTCSIFQFQPYNNLTKRKLRHEYYELRTHVFIWTSGACLSPTQAWCNPIYSNTNKNRNKQTHAPSKAHKMWRNKNIVSGEEPDNVVDEEGDALGIPKLRRLSLLEICRDEPRGHPQA